LQALFQKHSLTQSLMLTEGHWQVAEHSVANPPKTKLLKWFYYSLLVSRYKKGKNDKLHSKKIEHS